MLPTNSFSSQVKGQEEDRRPLRPGSGDIAALSVLFERSPSSLSAALRILRSSNPVMRTSTSPLPSSPLSSSRRRRTLLTASSLHNFQQEGSQRSRTTLDLVNEAITILEESDDGDSHPPLFAATAHPRSQGAGGESTKLATTQESSSKGNSDLARLAKKRKGQQH